jgi:hypothetical protein
MGLATRGSRNCVDTETGTFSLIDICQYVPVVGELRIAAAPSQLVPIAA